MKTTPSRPREQIRSRGGQILSGVALALMLAVVYYQNRFTEAPLSITDTAQQDSQHSTQQLMVEATPAQRASMQAHVETVPLQVWQTRSYCGGKRPSHEHEASLRHGTAAQGKRLFVKSGDSHSEAAAILMQLEPADAQGIVRVPHLDASHGLLTTENGASEGRLAALPSGAGASHVYCVVDLDAQAADHAMVDEYKRAMAAGQRTYLQVDLECMQRKWNRCDMVLRLDAPASLARQQARRPFMGIAPRQQTQQLDDSIPSVVGIIGQHLPCPGGRGAECTRWTGPLPK